MAIVSGRSSAIECAGRILGEGRFEPRLGRAALGFADLLGRGRQLAVGHEPDCCVRKPAKRLDHGLGALEPERGFRGLQVRQVVDEERSTPSSAILSWPSGRRTLPPAWSGKLGTSWLGPRTRRGAGRSAGRRAAN